MSHPSHPAALTAPSEPVCFVESSMLEKVLLASRQSPRKRMILPFHKHNDAVMHRMLNAVQPGSYVRPHRHLNPPKPESIFLIQGALVFVEFLEDGTLKNAVMLGGGTGVIAVDIEPGVIHSFYAVENDTVVFEVKAGPYSPANDKEFMPWAPAEGTPDAAAYLEALVRQVEDKRFRECRK